MRRISRIDRPIGQLRIRPNVPSRSPYLCALCKSQAPAFSTTTFRAADKKLPLTEKLRRSIWGTDKPPGLEDPYDNRSRFDQTNKRPQKQEEDEDDIEEVKAKRELSVPADLGTYEPARTWEGLDTVGDIEEEWDPEHVYDGFVPEEVVVDSDEATVALHRAVVEVFALKQAGLPLSGISNAEPEDDITTGVQISPSRIGATLQFTNEISLDEIVESLAAPVDETAEKEAPTESEEDVAADRSEVDPLHPEPESAVIDETSEKTNPTESEEDVAADRSTEDPLAGNFAPIQFHEIIATWDPAWLQVSLADPEVKFAVIKRTMQLTGIRLSDADINSSHTVQALLSHLVEPPKPKKVIDALLVKEELLTLPNVSVYASRITPIDKERSVGRWKIIEKELKQRGLPVTGHAL